MLSIQDLEKAVLSLPENEYNEFRQWFLDQDWKSWDREIEEDSREGRLDFLLEEAKKAACRAGKRSASRLRQSG